MCTCVCVHTACMHICGHTCMCGHVCMCVCTCVSVCVCLSDQYFAPPSYLLRIVLSHLSQVFPKLPLKQCQRKSAHTKKGKKKLGRHHGVNYIRNSPPEAFALIFCVVMAVALVHKLCSWLQLTIMTDDMDLAGDIIQALAQFLNLEDLLTTADFPVEIETLKQILFKVGWPLHDVQYLC